MTAAITSSRQFRAKYILEKQVDKQVRDFLELRGWRRVRFQATVIPGAFRTAEPGMADCLYLKYLDRSGVCIALWIETKRAVRGKLADDQRAWRDRELKRGAAVLCVNDIDVFMREYDRLFSWLHEGRFANSAHQTRFELEEEF